MSSVEQTQTSTDHDPPQLLASLRKDYSILSSRIRDLRHSVTSTCSGVTFRLHFPALRDGTATITDLINIIVRYLTAFALPRSRITDLDQLFGHIPPDDFRLRTLGLQQEATSLFIRSQRETRRNGEAGELLLFLLTEWILEAPQLLAKMSLKTNRNMPVHGSDGIHAKYCPITRKLLLYWGESKIHRDVGRAIGSAVDSIVSALAPESINHELKLVERFIDLSGLSPSDKSMVLAHLDPFDERSNQRSNVTTCLIAFDFDAYAKTEVKRSPDPEAAFRLLAIAKLAELAPRVATALTNAGLSDEKVEFFFFPVPSVDTLRNLFQTAIGWRDHDPRSLG